MFENIVDPKALNDSQKSFSLPKCVGGGKLASSQNSWKAVSGPMAPKLGHTVLVILVKLIIFSPSDLSHTFQICPLLKLLIIEMLELASICRTPPMFCVQKSPENSVFQWNHRNWGKTFEQGKTFLPLLQQPIPNFQLQNWKL